MHTDEKHHAARLFMLRIWLEPLGNGHSEWRIQMQQVGSGEVHYIRDWQMLIASLIDILTRPETGQSDKR